MGYFFSEKFIAAFAAKKNTSTIVAVHRTTSWRSGATHLIKGFLPSVKIILSVDNRYISQVHLGNKDSYCPIITNTTKTKNEKTHITLLRLTWGVSNNK